MYQYGNTDEGRKHFAYIEFEPFFEKIVASRTKIELSTLDYNSEVKKITKEMFKDWFKSKLMFWKKDNKETKEIQEEEDQSLSA